MLRLETGVAAIVGKTSEILEDLTTGLETELRIEIGSATETTGGFIRGGVMGLTDCKGRGIGIGTYALETFGIEREMWVGCFIIGGGVTGRMIAWGAIGLFIRGGVIGRVIRDCNGIDFTRGGGIIIGAGVIKGGWRAIKEGGIEIFDDMLIWGMTIGGGGAVIMAVEVIGYG